MQHVGRRKQLAGNHPLPKLVAAEPHPESDILVPHEYAIFLSHSEEQQGFANDLRNALTVLGITGMPTFGVDVDEHQLWPHTAEIRSRLARNILRTAGSRCTIGLVVVSDAYFSERWPMLQLLALVDARKKRSHDVEILPVYLGVSAADLGTEHNLSRWRKAWLSTRLPPPDCEDALHVLGESSCEVGLAYDAASEGQATFTKRIVERCKTILGSKTVMEGEARLREIVSRKFQEMQESPYNRQKDVSKTLAGSQFNDVAGPRAPSFFAAPASLITQRQGSDKSRLCSTLEQYYEHRDSHNIKPLYQLQQFQTIHPMDLKECAVRSLHLNWPANHVEQLKNLSMLHMREPK